MTFRSGPFALDSTLAHPAFGAHTPHPPTQRARTCWWVRFACPTSLSPSGQRKKEFCNERKKTWTEGREPALPAESATRAIIGALRSARRERDARDSWSSRC